MKQIKIANPTVVNTSPIGVGSGELRHPIEGALIVTDEEAERLHNNKLLDGEPEDVPEADTEEGDDEASELPEDLKGLKVADLKAKALKDGVPLHDANTKPTIIAAFVAHRASQA